MLILADSIPLPTGPVIAFTVLAAFSVIGLAAACWAGRSSYHKPQHPPAKHDH